MVKGIRSLALAAVLGGTIAPATLLAAPDAKPASARNQIETSLLVSGNVDIETDGSVSRLDIDQEDKLPAGVVKLVRTYGMQWKFAPVIRAGQVVKARAPLSLRVVAKKLDDGNYQVALRGVSFERYDGKDPESVASIKLDPPRYPSDAFRAGAGGTVYLVLKVSREGRVADALAEQVNLRIMSTDGEMRRLRNEFADSALEASRKWTFRVPTEGAEAAKPYWTVRVPVSYAIGYGRKPDDGYGTWINYVPGPRQTAPWEQDVDGGPGFEPDTLTDGGVYMANSNAPRLLTPLQGG